MVLPKSSIDGVTVPHTMLPAECDPLRCTKSLKPASTRQSDRHWRCIMTIGLPSRARWD